MQGYVDARKHRRARSEKEPVSDFLFEYYGIRPASLLKWTPGTGVTLSGDMTEFAGRQHFELFGTPPKSFARVSTNDLSESRWRAVDWIRVLLENVQKRPPFLGCSGMHEWAMVAMDGELRHRQLPLRLGKEAIDEVVRSTPIWCTHFDAFRFFAPSSRELNRVRPTHDRIHNLEQPGCLHANMDILRWALKLQPFVASEIVADAFDLAVDIREVDMRASPYDMSAVGLPPIAVETAAGRLEYRALQKSFFLRSQPVRRQLLQAVESLQEARAA